MAPDFSLLAHRYLALFERHWDTAVYRFMVTTTTTTTTPTAGAFLVHDLTQAAFIRPTPEPPPKWWRWFDIFRLPVDHTARDVQQGEPTRPARQIFGPSLAERRRLKRRRYLHQVVQGGAR